MVLVHSNAPDAVGSQLRRLAPLPAEEEGKAVWECRPAGPVQGGVAG